MAKDFERWVVISDPHCGGSTGLTPPEWSPPAKLKPHKVRRDEMWGEFAKDINRLKADGGIAGVIAPGDIIQGTPGREITDELICNETRQQKNMAIDVLKFVGAEKGIIVHGTPQHVGEGAYPIEKEIADAMGYEFHKIAEQFEVRGTVFNIKHFIGGSNRAALVGNQLSVAYGEIIANMQAVGVPSKAPHVLIRAHRHIFTARDYGHYMAVIAPCLQTWGAAFAVKYEGRYPTPGIMWFDIYGPGDFTFHKNLYKLKGHMSQAQDPRNATYPRQCPECGNMGKSKSKDRLRCGVCGKTWKKSKEDF
jgi:ribosomal protein S27AE